MSDTTVTVLTPPGSAAVAVLSVRGPDAWAVVQRHFRSAADKPLMAVPAGFVFGRIGAASADEVILAATGPDAFEIHCHGGPRVVSWLQRLMAENGVAEVAPPAPPTSVVAEAARLLPLARTTRTAAILLDQMDGAYDRAVAAIVAGAPEADFLREALRRNARVGRHLVRPWTVAIAGAPNAGKSSLVNALAGYSRCVVSPVPGTTRDVVSVSVAFDGWPVDLLDTAGLRYTAESLEAEGVERARTAAARSDLVLWVVDATGSRPKSLDEMIRGLRADLEKVVVVFNKADLADVPADEFPAAVRVSAVTGSGLVELAGRVAGALVPHAPVAGAPIPFTPELCDRWSRT